MNILEKKYGIKHDSALDMVRDGILSPTVLFHAEIFNYFSGIKKKAVDAVTDTAEHFQISEILVWKVLQKFRS